MCKSLRNLPSSEYALLLNYFTAYMIYMPLADEFFRCSTYVVYSYQHSEERENFLSAMLKDVDNWYIDCENLKKERLKLITQSSELQVEVGRL